MLVLGLSSGPRRGALVAACVLLVACPSDAVMPPDASTPDAEMGVGSDARSPADAGPDAAASDADGDGLNDAEEGLLAGVDSDGDGTPDGLDLDSDDNGVADADEAFRDEAGRLGDLDGDGTPDFRDLDDDGDGIPDAVERRFDPGDADLDGLLTYRDVDADGDAIRDADEWNDTFLDADGDGLPDFLDLDADGDGIPDGVEAGDSDLDTPPVDTDGDGIPDFRDLDSDDDGLPEWLEVVAGTRPTRVDSDGDGDDDLLEVGAGTDPNDPEDNATTRGWLVALVPFRQPSTPAEFPGALRYEVPASGVSGRVEVGVRDVSRGAQFLERVVVDTTSPGCDDAAAEDTDGDGFDDAFTAPEPGTRLCWRVVVRPNRTVPARRWNLNPECAEAGPAIFEAALAVSTAGGAEPVTRFLAVISPDCIPVGPDDARCTSCEPACRNNFSSCPCLC